MLFLLVFLVTVLVNLYIVVFGKEDLEHLKGKISLRLYLRELDASIVDGIGDRGATAVKLSIILLSVAVIIVNALTFLGCLVAVVLGTFVAKKLHQVSAVSNLLNKVATYINRLRQ